MESETEFIIEEDFPSRERFSFSPPREERYPAKERAPGAERSPRREGRFFWGEERSEEFAEVHRGQAGWRGVQG